MTKGTEGKEKPLTNNGEQLTLTMRWLTLAVTVVVTATGWFINRTLNQINDNITELKVELKNVAVIAYDHEARLRMIESKMTDIYNEMRSEHLRKQNLER